jgi:hypothetical protein
LGIEELQCCIQNEFHEVWNPDQILDEYKISFLRRLLNDGVLVERILEKARELRNSVVSYLAQEGLFDPVQYALVDIGWTGKTLDSLNDILRSVGYDGTLLGFYLGLSNEASTGQAKKLGVLDPKHMPFANLIEILASADHGCVQGYTKDPESGKWVPEVEANRLKVPDESHVNALRRGIQAFVGIFDRATLLDITENLEQFIERSVSLMHMLWSEPSICEAKALGAFPFSSDQAEVYVKSFAPRFSVTQAVRYVTSPRNLQKSFTWWPEATRTISGSIVRWLLSCRMQKVVRRVFAITRELARSTARLRFWRV